MLFTLIKEKQTLKSQCKAYVDSGILSCLQLSTLQDRSNKQLFYYRFGWRLAKRSSQGLNLPMEMAQFTDNNATGLIWQKCNRGQNNDATTADRCRKLLQQSQFSKQNLEITKQARIGNLAELQSIESLYRYTAFPATVLSSYWSSTMYAPDTTFVWIVNFNSGFMNNFVKTLIPIVKKNFPFSKKIVHFFGFKILSI